jgi:hypothetical protein
VLLLKLLEDPLTLVRTLLELTPKDGTTGEVKRNLLEELLILTKNYQIGKTSPELLYKVELYHARS